MGDNPEHVMTATGDDMPESALEPDFEQLDPEESVEGELMPEDGAVVGWLIRPASGDPPLRAEVQVDANLTAAELVELIGLLVESLPANLENMTALMQRIQGAQMAPPSS